MNKYELPFLNYPYDALEPFIDSETMKIHHTKHHQNYVNNLNISLSKYPHLQNNRSLECLLKNLSSVPEDIRTSVKNNGGGHWNHSFLWNILKKDTQYVLNNELDNLIKNYFQNLENFKTKFTQEAQNLFGSGWVFLILNFQNELKICSTPNQDTVLNIGHPLIGIDLWEHSYYLKYKNLRINYIQNFYSVINWQQVKINLNKALQSNLSKNINCKS